MAIILNSPETNTLKFSRPSILIRDNHLKIEKDSPWAGVLTPNKRLMDATRAVGRIETSDDTLEYVGTAFLVEKSIAITVDHVARTLKDAEKSWVNFSNFEDKSKERAKTVSYTHLTLPTTPYV